MRTGLRSAIAVALALAVSGAAVCFAAEPFRFVVVGDLPYKPGEAERVGSELVPAIRAGRFPFVVHVGDFKGGGDSCTDELMRAAHKTITGILPGRVFYTPGDNDWTDCDRAYLSAPMAELERLTFLRRLFFTDPPDLPADWSYRRQPDFPENAMWVYRGVQFATLHVVGTDNGRTEILLDDTSAALDAVDARDRANTSWLRGVFDAARRARAPAVVVAMQADMDRTKFASSCDSTRRQKCDAFLILKSALFVEAREFGGPVLLVHGDTSAYCLEPDTGRDESLPYWRLNSAGDGIFDASVVSVDPTDAERPFRVHRLLTGEEVRTVC